MAGPPEDPAGIGTPGDGQPDFSPPAASRHSLGPATPHPGRAPSNGPHPAAAVRGAAPPAGPPSFATIDAPVTAPAPPTGRAPGRRRPGRRTAVAAALVGSLLLVGVLSALPMLPHPTTVPPAPSAPPGLATASPSVVAGETRTLTTGGDLGAAIAFTGAEGSGTLTVASATWTAAGEAPPPEGRRYLVLDVTVACRAGQVPVDPLLLAATSGTESQLPGFGPRLDHPLGGEVLAAGDHVRGQVGFSVPAGTVQVSLLDVELRRLATVEVPAP